MKFGRILISACALCAASISFAVVGNVWHIPINAQPPGVPSMRNPLNPSSTAAVTNYNGSYSLDGNQSGGSLKYKRSSDLAWSSTALSFDTQNGNDKFWKGVIPTNFASPGQVVQYYFQINFTDRENTFIYGNNTQSFTVGSSSESSAAGNAFTFTASMPWPGGAAAGYPSDPANRIHHWKEEAIVGNQYMSVQIDQNGSLYDIYYPSVGFRNGSGTANEGYKGPEEFIGGPFGCPTDLQANGQMNVINGMGGLGVDGQIYWMKNGSNGPGPASYDNNSQYYVPDNNVVITSNRLNVTNNLIQVVQVDFSPSTNALPIVTDGTRTNYGVYVKRFLLTNLESTTRTIDFYYDVNFNVKGDNAHDGMFVDTRHAMVVFDNDNRTVTGTGCDPNGYGGTATTEYNPRTTASYDKSLSVYFGTVMKEVTNSLSGFGVEADGTWRDHTSTDNYEGWIGKRVTIPGNGTKEIDIMIVGSWDDNPSQTGTHTFWGRPLVEWFMTNSMATAQATTETFWTDWLAEGTTSDLPGSTYDTLFARSLLVTALHIDAKSGSIIAGMHNGAYPFVWPRDGIYAAITLDRTGHHREAENFYHWLRDVAFRAADCNPGSKSFFFQKYSTDGYFAWNSPQIDETASVPWGIFYHYLSTADLGFLSNYAGLVRETAWASIWDSCFDGRANYNDTFKLMDGNNVWEDSFALFIYSNASVVRGLQDAVNVANKVPGLIPGGDLATWTTVANETRDIGIVGRVNARVEPADISHLGLAVPYEVFEPTNSVMLAIREWISGNGAPAGGFNDNLEETGGGNVGYWRRYNHNINGNIDNYWNGGPWHLSTAWFGEYNVRWQDYSAGKTLADTGKDMLDKLVARLGPVGLGAEQIAPDTAQKYPGFWHQAAWPNVWESHSTFLDLMMMFLDYKPAGTNNNTCYFAPKLPTGWNTMAFNNLSSQGQRFNFTVAETNNSTRADINKLTAGALNYQIWLRIPTGETPAIVLTNGARTTSFTYDAPARRVYVQGAFNNAAGANSIIVTYGNSDVDGDGLLDSYEAGNGLNPLDAGGVNGADGDLDGDGMSNLQEQTAGTQANNANSLLRITSIKRLPSTDTAVTWDSVTGKQYIVQSADVLPGTFSDLSSTLTASGASTSYTNTTGIAARFYRVKLVP